MNLPLLLILLNNVEKCVCLSTFTLGGCEGAGADEGGPLGTAAPGRLWRSDRTLFCAHITLGPGLRGYRFRLPPSLVIACRAEELKTELACVY